MNTFDAGKLPELVNRLLHHHLIDVNEYTLSVRAEDQMICVPLDRQGGMLSVDDLVRIDLNHDVPAFFERYTMHSTLYRAYPRFNVIMYSCVPALLTLSIAGKTVKPVLDDFAQLIGVNARVVDGNDEKSLVCGIKNRNAVFIKNEGAICAASDEDDIFAVSFVLHKNAVALIETAVLGGGKPISWIESALMNIVYKRRYSKNANK